MNVVGVHISAGKPTLKIVNTEQITDLLLTTMKKI